MKNRQELETIKGANPTAIKTAIDKRAGPAQRNYVEAGASPADKALQGHVSQADLLGDCKNALTEDCLSLIFPDIPYEPD